jgi:hypothetical protein
MQHLYTSFLLRRTPFNQSGAQYRCSGDLELGIIDLVQQKMYAALGHLVYRLL